MPEIRFDDRHRADKPAETRAIGSQNDRHIAGKIDRTDGVRVVMNIRGMKSRFAAAVTGPDRLWPYEAHAGSAGVKVHFPFCGKEGRNIVRREELRRAVGAVNHAQRANRREIGAQRSGQFCSGCVRSPRREMQHIAAAQRTTSVSAKLTEGKGTFAA